MAEGQFPGAGEGERFREEGFQLEEGVGLALGAINRPREATAHAHRLAGRECGGAEGSGAGLGFLQAVGPVPAFRVEGGGPVGFNALLLAGVGIEKAAAGGVGIVDRDPVDPEADLVLIPVACRIGVPFRPAVLGGEEFVGVVGAVCRRRRRPFKSESRVGGKDRFDLLQEELEIPHKATLVEVDGARPAAARRDVWRDDLRPRVGRPGMVKAELEAAPLHDIGEGGEIQISRQVAPVAGFVLADLQVQFPGRHFLAEVSDHPAPRPRFLLHKFRPDVEGGRGKGNQPAPGLHHLLQGLPGEARRLSPLAQPLAAKPAHIERPAPRGEVPLDPFVVGEKAGFLVSSFLHGGQWFPFRFSRSGTPRR